MADRRSGYRHVFRPSTPGRAAAVAAMALSALAFAAMTLCARLVSTGAAGSALPAAEVTLFRFAFGTAVMLPLLAYPRARLLGSDRVGLVWRGVSGGLAVLAFFMSLKYTSLTNAVLLNFSSIIFAPLFAALLLRERLPRHSLPPLLAAACGIVLVVRPEAGPPRIGDAYGLLSGVLSGSAITAVRRLRTQETASSVFFYFSAIGVPIAATGTLWSPWVWPSERGWWLLVAMAACSATGQMLMTFGYRYVRAAEGVLITLSQVVYSAMFGALLLGEPLAPSTLLGGALVVAAAVRAGTMKHAGRV